MIHVRGNQQLAQTGIGRAIHRLSGGQIELRWDHLVLHMRPADLLVLHQALLRFAEATGREWTSDYCIEMGFQTILLNRVELAEFARMVHQAAESLPRRVVHWTDIPVRINAVDGGFPPAHLSPN